MLALHKNALLYKKLWKILPENMLSINNSYVTAIYTEDISEMKFQIHHLHLEQFLFKKHDKHFRHYC